MPGKALSWLCKALYNACQLQLVPFGMTFCKARSAKLVGLFSLVLRKRDLQKRPIFCKERGVLRTLVPSRRDLRALSFAKCHSKWDGLYIMPGKASERESVCKREREKERASERGREKRRALRIVSRESESEIERERERESERE